MARRTTQEAAMVVGPTTSRLVTPAPPHIPRDELVFWLDGDFSADDDKDDDDDVRELERAKRENVVREEETPLEGEVVRDSELVELGDGARCGPRRYLDCSTSRWLPRPWPRWNQQWFPGRFRI